MHDKLVSTASPGRGKHAASQSQELCQPEPNDCCRRCGALGLACGASQLGMRLNFSVTLQGRKSLERMRTREAGMRSQLLLLDEPRLLAQRQTFRSASVAGILPPLAAMSGRKESRSVCGCCSFKDEGPEKAPAPPLSPKVRSPGAPALEKARGTISGVNLWLVRHRCVLFAPASRRRETGAAPISFACFCSSSFSVSREDWSARGGLPLWGRAASN